ncbi:hypothetical protein EBX93_13710 [bacterium]|nr:hypothetical protein [bacterium]
MRGLAQPEMKNQVVTKSGYNNDIIVALNGRFPMAVEQTKGVKFSGDNLNQKGRAIWNYLNKNIRYKKDNPGKQVIQLPARMIRDTGAADCKSLALAAAAFMKNNGFPDVALRYSSYNPIDDTPTHVYAVAKDEKGNEIIVDPVYKQYNREVPYKFKKDYKMEISVLSGIGQMKLVKAGVVPGRPRIITTDPVRQAEKILMGGKVKPGSIAHNVLVNFINRRTGKAVQMSYDPKQLVKYGMKLRFAANRLKSPYIKNLIQQEMELIRNNQFTGSIVTSESAAINGVREEIGKISLRKIGKGIKKAAKKISIKNIVKGVKAVGLVLPRKAFLALVSLNVRGLAKRMSQLTDDEIKKLWVKKFGGDFKVLKRAIEKGKKKKPLFGASKKVRAIKGVGYVVSDDSSIGLTGGEVAAIIASAAPILVAVTKMLQGKGIPDVPESAANPGESGDFPESPGQEQEQKKSFLDYAAQALNIAKETGIIPERPLTPQQAMIDQAIPGDDHTDMSEPSATGTGFKINPLILVGAAGAAALLLMRKK